MSILRWNVKREQSTSPTFSEVFLLRQASSFGMLSGGSPL